MTLMELLRPAFRPRKAARFDCFGCTYFRNDAKTIEQALPGISSFSSAHASVRADDGLCTRHDTLLNGRRACADYSVRT